MTHIDTTRLDDHRPMADNVSLPAGIGIGIIRGFRIAGAVRGFSACLPTHHQ
jgi:hypothetical protein